MVDRDDDCESPIHAWALLGVGARGKAFRGCRYELPFGWIGWIRWRDAAWPDGHYPTLTLDSERDSSPLPEEWSEDWLDLSASAGRLVVHVAQDPAPWDSPLQAAYAVSDLLQSLETISLPIEFERGIVGLRDDALTAGEIVIRDLPAEDSPERYLSLEWETALRDWSHRSDDLLDQHLTLCNPILRDGDGRRWGIFPALIYHRLSVADFGFAAPDDVRQVIGRHDMSPEAPFHQARAEESFHNAFKAIEAALGGEPSSDTQKLGRLLLSRGIDPSADPRFPDNTTKTLIARIHRLADLRDKRSAHGGRSSGNRHLSYHDILEAQWIASALVFEVLNAAGRLDKQPD